MARPFSGPDWAGSVEVDGALAAAAGVPAEVGEAEADLAVAAASADLAEAVPEAAAPVEAGSRRFAL